MEPIRGEALIPEAQHYIADGETGVENESDIVYHVFSSSSTSLDLEALPGQIPIYIFIRKYSKEVKLAFINSEKIFSEEHDVGMKKTAVHSNEIMAVLEENNINLVRWKAFYYDECEQAYLHLKTNSFVPISYRKPLEVVSVVTKHVDQAIYITLENNRLPTGNYHEIKAEVGTCLKMQATEGSISDSGWFSIGIHRGKVEANHGTLWRSSYQFGAAFIFSIGARYKSKIEKRADTFNTYTKVPFLQFKDSEQFLNAVPYNAAWVAVEMGGQPLETFIHPDRCVYILGSEDHGLPKELLAKCRFRVSLPSVGCGNFNVSAAGSIIMYDRYLKRNTSYFAIEPSHATGKQNSVHENNNIV